MLRPSLLDCGLCLPTYVYLSLIDFEDCQNESSPMIFFPKILHVRFYPGMDIFLLITQASVTFTPGKQQIKKCQYCL